MDKLVNRAGVAMLVLIATAGSAFAWGLARYAASVDSPEPPTLKLTAALKAPRVSLAAPLAQTPAVQPLPPVERDLGRAFSRALGPAQKKSGQRLKTPDLVPEQPGDAPEIEPSRSDDLLDFGPGGNEREAKLGEREAKAFRVRQPGGAEAQHKVVKESGERVTFETDLGKPGDH